MKTLLIIIKYFLACTAIVSYIGFIYGSEAEFSHYLLVSNIVNLFIIIVIYINIRLNRLIKRQNYALFPESSIKLTLLRILHLFKDLPFIILILSSILILFNNSIGVKLIIIYFVSLLLQQVFTIITFVSLWDYLSLKNYEKHINIIIPLIASLLIFARNQPHGDIIYLTNPFGGLMNLPIFLYNNVTHNLLVFFIIPLLLLTVLYLNKILIKTWL